MSKVGNALVHRSDESIVMEFVLQLPELDGDTRWSRRWCDDFELARLRAVASFRSLPWYRRAWLTLTGKAPR